MPMRAILAGAPVAEPRRGEIYRVNLDPAKGREQKGLRPCLVISSDALNKSGLGFAVVCPLTTRHKPSFAWRTELDVADIEIVDAEWKVERSWIQTDQLLTLDVDDGRFQKHLGTVRKKQKLSHAARTICQIVSA